MTADPAGSGGRWADLRPRVLSAVVMVLVGAAEIWLGGRSFAVLAILLTGGMIWELARITAPGRRGTPLVMGAIGAGSLLAALVLRGDLAPLALLVPSLALALTPRRDRRIATVYAAAVCVTGFALVDLREAFGQSAILWLISVVVASDVMGYFAKFWPAISPKKTWSGTVAGWIGAVVVGFLFWRMGFGTVWVLLLSPVVAFAGQLGDIAESWLKRRAGIKDSSHLIPGHGGLLDRFDALIGATVVLMLIGLVLPLPIH
jgi:phosphatidate cytidylyltransferase